MVNVIGCVCSTLFKGHPAVERFEWHTVLLNMVMNDASRPNPGVYYRLHYARPLGCGCNQCVNLMESEIEPANAGGCETYHDAVAVNDIAQGKDTGARLKSSGAPLKYVAVSKPS